MPGFLGGSSGSSGTGGEIIFPKEFIDPVTKLRVSQPENLIDTDFEYGLQPTKWETVELINNTPSFFSKSGDTTIPGIVSISTNSGTREITVTTATEHGLAVGIPINVTGTKSVTADGSYVINSIPNTFVFTYLCRDEQAGNNSIEDLYSSIITGEFFQGSQIRIADAEGVTTDAEPFSTLTVKTDSTHGFGLNTPFYFLNLNSTISQEFEASNTAAKSFDSSNSATAQTFDGSNTLSTFNIDWSNSATVGGVTSTITDCFVDTDTIRVSHGAENFAGQPLGTPLYYNLTVPASSGYFLNNPRGVVFLKTINALNTPAGQSTFQVSDIPDGDAIDIVSNMTGTFQLANQARTFAGNNIDTTTQITIPVVVESSFALEGANDGGLQSGGLYTNGNPLATLSSYSGSLVNVTVTAGAGLGYYTGAMILYSTTGSAASGLTNNTTYFIDSFFSTGTNTFAFTLKALPTSASPITISGGTGTQTFTRIGVSPDKDVWHIRNSNYIKGDMLEYTFPDGGAVVDDTAKTFFFVDLAYDSHNYLLSDSLFSATTATGGVISQTTVEGQTFNVHTFATLGTTNFVVSSVGTEPYVDYLIVGGGGGGGMDMGGGGGGGGVLTGRTNTITAATYPVVVGAGGNGSPAGGTNGQPSSHIFTVQGTDGGNSSFNSLIALGGGLGGMSHWPHSNTRASGRVGGSGGGASGYDTPDGSGAGAGTAGQGFAGGAATGSYFSGGGGGAGAVGGKGNWGRAPYGGLGKFSMIDGNPRFYGGGGGGSGYTSIGGDGGYGGGGAGSVHDTFGGIYARNNGENNSAGEPDSQTNQPGRNGGTNTGGGGGGGSHYFANNKGGEGGSGIVILRYPTTPRPVIIPTVASGGTESTVAIGKINYRVHQYTTVGTFAFTVTTQGSSPIQYLVVAGGGGGGTQHSGGGGAGGYRCSVPGEFSGRLTAAETPLTLTAGSYTVVVGDGGAGAPGNAAQGVNGFRGGNSQFHTITSIGGGGGGSWAADNGSDRRSGGSGGGGRADGSAWAGGAGTAGQGFDGGFSNATPSQPHVGAGGGGAGSAGEQNYPNRTVRSAGRGGHGICSNITGTPTIRGAGGGGGAYWSSGQKEPARAYSRQNSGGGDGGRSFQSNGAAEASGGNGSANTGGGGGCAGQYERTGGTGGTGVVIIRYPIGYID
jgi:hypothetical protein